MLYLQGAPPTLECLTAALQTEARQERWKEYVADCACVIARALMPKSKLPFWTDVAGDRKSHDSRSGQDIVNDLIARRRRKRRKEAKK